MQQLESLEKNTSNYAKCSKFFNSLTKKSKQQNLMEVIREFGSLQKGEHVRMINDVCRIIEKEIERANSESKVHQTKLIEEKSKIQNLLENQRKLHAHLKKTLPQNITETHFEHPSHSDTQELTIIANIEKTIKEGGEWWKKVPRKIRRHDSFSPVYNIVERLKDK